MEEGSAREGSNTKESAFINKLNDFVVQKHKIILIAILAFAFIIRMKYMTINAAVWWDEADYLTLAKHYAFGLPEQAAPWRARAIPLLWALFYKLGANEWFIRFFNQFIAVGAVLVTYLIGKEFYSKTAGLLASLFMAVYFEHLFWSARLSADLYSLVLFGLAALFFYKGYVKDEGKKYLYATGAIYGAGIYAYDGVGFLAIFLLIFLLVTERLRFLKDKRVWIMVGIALLAMLPFAIYNQVEFGHPYPRLQLFSSIEGGQITLAEGPQQGAVAKTISLLPDTFSYITSVGYYLGSGLPATGLGSIAKWALIIAFIAGLAAFINMFIGFDKVWKKENRELTGDFYILLWGFSVLLIFGIVNAISAFIFEPRFVFPAMPVIFVIAAEGIRKIYSLIKQQNRIAAVAIVSLIVISAVYSQLAFADLLIGSKSDTYRAEKEAGLWLKENTKNEAHVVGCGLALPLIYYTEKDFKNFGDNFTIAGEFMDKYSPDFVVIDGFDPACRANYPQTLPDKFRPVQAFYLDREKTQPIVVIYQAI